MGTERSTLSSLKILGEVRYGVNRLQTSYLTPRTDISSFMGVLGKTKGYHKTRTKSLLLEVLFSQKSVFLRKVSGSTVNLEEVQETPGLDPSSTQNQQSVQRVAQRAEAPSWLIKSKEMPEMFGHQTSSLNND